MSGVVFNNELCITFRDFLDTNRPQKRVLREKLVLRVRGWRFLVLHGRDIVFGESVTS